MRILVKLYTTATILILLSLMVTSCEHLNNRRTNREEAAKDQGATNSSTSESPVQTASLSIEQQLDALRARDKEAVENLVGFWVPQFASGVADQDTLDLHNAKWHAQFGAVLLKSDDYVGYPNYWASVSTLTFDSSSEVLDWCQQQHLVRNDCAAKFITHDTSVTDTIRYQE